MTVPAETNPASKLKVGDTVWAFDVPVRITGETSRMLLIGEHKIPKNHVGVEFYLQRSLHSTRYFLTHDAMVMGTLSSKRYAIEDALKKANVEQIKQVCAILGIDLFKKVE